jgi:drug/metabolite transporter (DMT)-like permease
MVSTVVVWSIYTVIAKRLAQSDQIVVTAFNMTLAALLMIPLVLLDLQGQSFPALSAESWIKVVYLGLMASGAAFVVYNIALRELDATAVGVWMNLVPIVGMLAAVIFLGESLNPWQIAGAVVALAGMWLSS